MFGFLCRLLERLVLKDWGLKWLSNKEESFMKLLFLIVEISSERLVLESLKLPLIIGAIRRIPS